MRSLGGSGITAVVIVLVILAAWFAASILTAAAFCAFKRHAERNR